MQRFWNKVNKTETCWLWTAGKAAGYGRFMFEGRNVLAHRWAYENARGSVPEGLTLDHLCRTKHCVNPDHLEAVPGAVNNSRAANSGRPQGSRSSRTIFTRNSEGLWTHCVAGHEYVGDNLYVRPSGVRDCRKCNAARVSSRYFILKDL